MMTFADGAKDLRPGDEIVVLTWLHLSPRDEPSTHPEDDTSQPITGVFSTCSPNRPNPIGLHRARIVPRDGLRIKVDALEAIDGTPVVDVKRPVTRAHDAQHAAEAASKCMRSLTSNILSCRRRALHPVDAGDPSLQAIDSLQKVFGCRGGVLDHSPAEDIRRPSVPPESPTLGFTHLQFEAMLTAGRESANPSDFALVAMLGLLGLRIFEATSANIADLGEEHGH